MSVLKELEGLLRDRGYLQEGESIPVVLKDEIDTNESNIGFCAENNAVVALSVRYCGLTSLPESLGQLTNLRRLDLTGNQLTSLPEWLGNLVQLRRLYLDENQLTSLPESLGNLLHLEEVHVDKNQLTS
ncbi:MAG: leucine-rich repeat domain-containing protein, partial [Chloroflexi bacterium]